MTFVVNVTWLNIILLNITPLKNCDQTVAKKTENNPKKLSIFCDMGPGILRYCAPHVFIFVTYFKGAELKNNINFLPICISVKVIVHANVQQNMMCNIIPTNFVTFFSIIGHDW